MIYYDVKYAYKSIVVSQGTAKVDYHIPQYLLEKYKFLWDSKIVGKRLIIKGYKVIVVEASYTYYCNFEYTGVMLTLNVVAENNPQPKMIYPKAYPNLHSMIY